MNLHWTYKCDRPCPTMRADLRPAPVSPAERPWVCPAVLFLFWRQIRPRPLPSAVSTQTQTSSPSPRTRLERLNARRCPTSIHTTMQINTQPYGSLYGFISISVLIHTTECFQYCAISSMLCRGLNRKWSRHSAQSTVMDRSLSILYKHTCGSDINTHIKTLYRTQTHTPLQYFGRLFQCDIHSKIM